MHNTAHGSQPIHESWHNHTARARREHIYGKIRGIQKEARGIGEPSWAVAVCWGLAFVVCGVLALVAWS